MGTEKVIILWIIWMDDCSAAEDKIWHQLFSTMENITGINGWWIDHTDLAHMQPYTLLTDLYSNGWLVVAQDSVNLHCHIQHHQLFLASLLTEKKKHEMRIIIQAVNCTKWASHSVKFINIMGTKLYLLEWCNCQKIQSIVSWCISASMTGRFDDIEWWLCPHLSLGTYLKVSGYSYNQKLSRK